MDSVQPNKLHRQQGTVMVLPWSGRRTITAYAQNADVASHENNTFEPAEVTAKDTGVIRQTIFSG